MQVLRHCDFLVSPELIHIFPTQQLTDCLALLDLVDAPASDLIVKHPQIRDYGKLVFAALSGSSSLIRGRG